MKNIEDLYKKGAKESPPSNLDNLILSAAKQSCKQTSNPIKTSKPWLYLIPIAAVMVMSFSVILNLQHENSYINQGLIISSSKDDIQKSELNEAVSTDKKFSIETDNKPNKISVKKYKYKNQGYKSDQDDDSRSAIMANSSNDELMILSKKQMPKMAPKTLGISAKRKSTNKPIAEQIVEKHEEESKRERIVGTIIADSVAPPKSIKPLKAKEEFESIPVGPVIEQDQEEDIGRQKEDEAELERVITTGAHISASELELRVISNDKERANNPKLDAQLKKLENLILHKRINKAKRLLKDLKDNFPKFDFSQYEDLIHHNS
jgi:hypothetical protein